MIKILSLLKSILCESFAYLKTLCHSQTDLYLCFIDYSKAFDKVRHEKLFNILEHLDIDGKDLRVIRNLYWDQSAAVRIGGELSEYTLIKRGVRQGCVMSPDLFNIYSEMILRNLENYPGVKINGENINNIRYADDTVLIADSEENLQRLLELKGALHPIVSKRKTETC